jgi:peptidoglycan hydrolase-like protein with peptidoglycan-binding domain
MALTRAQITEAQKKLNGWWEVTPKLVTDGIFGANTARGVRQFQARVGLPQTGQLDAQTLARLGVQATNASGNPNSGFFQWSLEARRVADELEAFKRSLNPLDPNYAPLQRQAAALQQVAQQTDARAQQTASAGAQPDPALLAQIEQLRGEVSRLTGNAPGGGTDFSKYLIWGVAAIVVIALLPRD